ncbi:hypothetical protein BJ165DRAFT_1410151 [Panaeolus papilionaceus]|nr:hypothetical protein BJ165DRAFT_1410151 [Panaeolus papilionaceus]
MPGIPYTGWRVGYTATAYGSSRSENFAQHYGYFGAQPFYEKYAKEVLDFSQLIVNYVEEIRKKMGASTTAPATQKDSVVGAAAGVLEEAVIKQAANSALKTTPRGFPILPTQWDPAMHWHAAEEGSRFHGQLSRRMECAHMLTKNNIFIFKAVHKSKLHLITPALYPTEEEPVAAGDSDGEINPEFLDVQLGKRVKRKEWGRAGDQEIRMAIATHEGTASGIPATTSDKTSGDTSSTEVVDAVNVAAAALQPLTSQNETFQNMEPPRPTIPND